VQKTESNEGIITFRGWASRNGSRAVQQIDETKGTSRMATVEGPRFAHNQLARRASVLRQDLELAFVSWWFNSIPIHLEEMRE
jgi:hypothetical protein